MTYGRRHYLTQQVLVRLAYSGPTSSETREFVKASARLVLAMTLIFFGLAALAAGAELSPGQTSASPAAATTGGDILADFGDDRLTLITCFPFDAIQPGGPERYVVTAIRSGDRAAMRLRSPSARERTNPAPPWSYRGGA